MWGELFKEKTIGIAKKVCLFIFAKATNNKETLYELSVVTCLSSVS